MGTSKVNEDQAVVGDSESKDERRPALPAQSMVAATQGDNQDVAVTNSGPISTAEFYKHNSSIPARLMEVLHPTLETMSNLHATLEAQLAAKRTENKQLHEELQAARKRLADNEKNTAAFYNENQILHEKLQRTWQEHAEIDRKLSSRASSCLRAVQRVCSSRMDSDKLLVENQGIYAELQSARRYQMSLEKDVAAHQDTVFHLRQKLDIAQRQISQLEKAYAAKSERYQRLKFKLEAANCQKDELKQMLSKQSQQQELVSAGDKKQLSPPQQPEDVQSNSSNSQNVSTTANGTAQPDQGQQLEAKPTADGVLIIALNQKTSPTSQPAQTKITLQSQTLQTAHLPPRSPEIQPIVEPVPQNADNDTRGMRSQSAPRSVNAETDTSHTQPRRTLTISSVQNPNGSMQSMPRPRPSGHMSDVIARQHSPSGNAKAGQITSSGTPPSMQVRSMPQGLVPSTHPAMLAMRPPLPATQRAATGPVVPRAQIQLQPNKLANAVRGATDAAKARSASAMPNGNVQPTQQVMVRPRTQDTPFALVQQQLAVVGQKQTQARQLPRTQDTPLAVQQQQAAAPMPRQMQMRQLPRAQDNPFAAQMQQQAAAAMREQAQARPVPRAQDSPIAAQMQQQVATAMQKQAQTRAMPRAQDSPFAAQMQQQAATAMQKQAQTRAIPRAHNSTSASQVQQQVAPAYQQQLRPAQPPNATLRSIWAQPGQAPPQPQQVSKGSSVQPMQACAGMSKQGHQAPGIKAVEVVATSRMDIPQPTNRK